MLLQWHDCSWGNQLLPYWVQGQLPWGIIHAWYCKPSQSWWPERSQAMWGNYNWINMLLNNFLNNSCLCPRLAQILALIREASFDSGQWSKCRLITQQSIENKGCKVFNLKMEHLCHSLLGPGEREWWRDYNTWKMGKSTITCLLAFASWTPRSKTGKQGQLSGKKEASRSGHG